MHAVIGQFAGRTFPYGPKNWKMKIFLHQLLFARFDSSVYEVKNTIHSINTNSFVDSCDVNEVSLSTFEKEKVEFL